MRFGITLLTDQPWREAAPRWRAAEELGFDHAWTYDHLIWSGLTGAPWRGATPVLAAAAGVTSSIRLGTLVASPNFRHPYQLFRDAQALEDVSDGRFVLGIGAGGDTDSAVLGVPRSRKERSDRFEEALRALVRLRDADPDEAVDLAGEHVRTAGARTAPGLPRTPFLVAGDGPRAIRLAVELGDAWVLTGPWGVPLADWWSGVEVAVGRAEEALAATGRAGLDRHLLLDAAPSGALPEGRTALASVGFFEELVGRASELGFTDVTCHWPRADQPYAADEATLERVAADVLPRWR
ncbi:LLM class flavin-dependent oxidoreductase [Nocardioides sp. TRM66260-LWL]|uniref:LLM class flavin-dependent oxidoreductase n=1 Tax=Nocardioides sp. TRM66260-LWL TaxID=2874478 RepID=UPI001CC47676|nr:LLM class flavin-dependent oxidoreductase [Nocardioides sp. TRM66260-LWL]MBZ5735618.1 LLM class flavin-dependent oxidoreductase [Nocardioides sp. TRM66260-LWL]